MALNNLYDIAGSSLSSQSVRLNAVASNIANANSAASSPEATYRALKPVFSVVYDQVLGEDQLAASVEVETIRVPGGDEIRRYDPDHPLANEQGYVFYPNISIVEEMADMISASRSYQTNLEVMNTAKQLQQRLLTLGQ